MGRIELDGRGWDQVRQNRLSDRFRHRQRAVGTGGSCDQQAAGQYQSSVAPNLYGNTSARVKD